MGVRRCGLHPPATATTADNTGDEPFLTDGPFVVAKEHPGGFWIIEAPDLDAALGVGHGQLPGAR